MQSFKTCIASREVRLCESFRRIKELFFSDGKTQVCVWITLILDISLGYCADVMLALLNKGVINSVTSLNYAAFISSIWLGVAAVIVYLINVLDRYFNMRSIRYIMLDLRHDLFRHMEFLSVGYFEQNHSADSIFRLTAMSKT